MRIAVLGSNGQVGSFLVKWLVARKVGEIVSIVRNRTARQYVEGLGSEIRVGAATDPNSARALFGDCDVVVNCAWPDGLPRSIRQRNEAIAKNILSLTNIKQLVTLSSAAVYGATIEGRNSTFDHPVPGDTYGRLKLGFERYIEKIGKNSAAEIVILRLGHVFGPHQWVSRLIANLLEDPQFRLPYNGEFPSNAIHIDEVCSAIESIIRNPIGSKIFNLASQPQKSWREVFNWHSTSLSLPPAHMLNTAQSNRCFAGVVSETRGGLLRSIGRTIYGSCLSFFRGMVNDDKIKEIILYPLSFLPEKVGKKIKCLYAVRKARAEIAQLQSFKVVSPIFFYNAMPGPYLTTEMPESDQNLAQDWLKKWYTQTRTPGVILDNARTNI